MNLTTEIARTLGTQTPGTQGTETFRPPPAIPRDPAAPPIAVMSSLKGRIVVLFSLAFLVTGWLVAVYLAASLQDNIEQLLFRQQFSFVSNLVEELDQKIQLELDALQQVAASIDAEMLESGDETARYLRTRLGVHGIFTGGLMVAGSGGHLIGEFPDHGRKKMNFAAFPFFEAVRATEKATVSEPYWSPFLEEPVVTMAAPIRDAREGFIGVLMGTIRLSQPNFLGKITDHKVGHSGGIYIISSVADVIIVSTDKGRIYTPAPARGTNPMLDRYRDGFEGSGVTVSSRGIEELTSARAIPSTGWVVVARLPTAEAFKPIQDLKRRVIVTMAVFSAVVVALLWLVLTRALQPLAAATADIRDMVDGRKALRPVAGGNGGEVGAMLSAFNALQSKITASEAELKRSQAALQEREALYRSLFQDCKAVELLIDPEDRRIIDANTAAVAYYGWPRETLTAMRITDINTLDAATVNQEMRRANAEERDHFIFRHRLANGALRDVEVRSGPVTVNGRKLLYSLVHDITERRQAERENCRLLEFRRAVLDAAGSAIIATDAEGVIRLFNPTAERWLGYTAAEVVGWETPVIFHDPDEIAAYARILICEWGCTGVAGFDVFAARPKTSGLPDVREWSYLRRDGSRFPVLLAVTALYDEAGEPNGFLGVAQDISALKTLERELKRSNEELEHFAYVASHDLRQPLRMVSSYVALLDRKLKGQLDEDGRTFIHFAVDGARRMDRMILDLLEYSRIGRAQPVREKVSLEAAAAKALADLSDTIAQAGAAVVVAPGTSGGALPTILGNPTELERLFRNLIGNAIKFRVADRPPVVDISWRATPEGGAIAIVDNGIGIDPKDYSRLFHIFQRLVSNDQYDGTGIGLASCRKIAERHGGSIRVESQPGAGSTFLVSFPKSVLPTSVLQRFAS